MLGAKGSEDYRTRVGFICLILGLLLVFWAWGSWIYRSSVPAQAQAMARSQATNGSQDGPAGNGAMGDRAKVTRAVWLFLLVGAALVLLVIFGSYAVVRVMRRYRSVLDTEQDGSGSPSDVWSQHKLPPGAEDDFDDERPDG